jgi:hypothetical protein
VQFKNKINNTMPDDNKISLKEKRQIREDIKTDKDVDKKALRQKSRVDKLAEQRQVEAKKAGVDVNKPIDIGPPSTERKAEIDKIIREGVSEDLLGGLKKIQALRQPPDVEVPEIPKTDLTIKDVRKERRAKMADILSSLGKGLKGKEVDPTKYRDLLKSERDVQYQQYKDTAQAAKKRLEEWQAGYIDEQLKYLDGLKTNATEKERLQIEKLEAQLRYDLARATRAEKLAKAPVTEGEDDEGYVTRAYTTREGEKITRRIPKDDPSIQEEILRDQELRSEIEAIDKDIAGLKDQLDVLVYTTGDKGEKGSAISGTDKAALNLKIKALNDKKQQLIKQGATQSKQTTKTEPLPEDVVKTDFTEIINKHKVSPE